jgi:phosphohistidine phosphatase
MAQDGIFLLGHNPACTDLVNYLAGRHVLDNLPTAGFASLQLDIDRWRDLRQGCGSLQATLFPRQLEHP